MGKRQRRRERERGDRKFAQESFAAFRARAKQSTKQTSNKGAQ